MTPNWLGKAVLWPPACGASLDSWGAVYRQAIVSLCVLAAVGLVSLALLIWRMRLAGLRHPSHYAEGAGTP